MRHFRYASPSADPLAGYAPIAALCDDDAEPRCDFCERGYAETVSPEGFPCCEACAEEREAFGRPFSYQAERE